MKQGLAIADLAQELRRQAAAKRDFVADTRSVTPFVGDDDIGIELQGTGAFGVTDWAHNQFAERLGIPRAYYSRMRTDAPDLLVENMSHWLNANEETRLVRTLDDRVRAFLSSGYRPLDNLDFAEPVLQAVSRTSFEVVSCDVTEKRLYIKCIDPSPEAAVEIMPTGLRRGVGHNRFYVVRPGFSISNSEVGCGALALAPAIQEDHCTNLAVFSSDAMKRTHIGKRYDASETPYEVSVETRQLQDAAIWSEVQDALQDITSGAAFNRHVDKLRAAHEDTFKKPTSVVQEVTKKFSLTKAEGESVLEHLCSGGDLSRYGVHSAITRAAQDVESYDRATELERLGGRIIELSRTDWDLIARRN